MELRCDPNQILHLVRLEMANQAPVDRQIAQGGHLVAGLLELVFSEIGNPCCIGEPQDMGGNRLSDGEKAYIVRGSPTTMAGGRNARPYSFQIRRKCRCRIVTEAGDFLWQKLN